MTPWEFKNLWQNIVEQFSRRSLSISSDKLDAVAGVADDLGRRLPNQFLAGLWREDLVSHLSWYQNMSLKGFEAIAWNTERSCPSWSWIGLDGPISFSKAEKSGAVVESATITRSEIEIVDAHPQPRLVVEGVITLRLQVSQLPMADVISHLNWFEPGSPRAPAFSNILYLDGGKSNPFIRATVIEGNSGFMLPSGMRFAEVTRDSVGAQHAA